MRKSNIVVALISEPARQCSPSVAGIRCGSAARMVRALIGAVVRQKIHLALRPTFPYRYRAVLANQGGRMRRHVALCYMVVGCNLNSPLNLFISFAKALMEQGFLSDPFLAKDR